MRRLRHEWLLYLKHIAPDQKNIGDEILFVTDTVLLDLPRFFSLMFIFVHPGKFYS